MSQATIRTAVYNAVNGVTNAGKVYDYERWSTDWLVFLDQFKTSIGGKEQIRGWMVAYRGFTNAPIIEAVNVPGAGKQSLIAREHSFIVMGFMGLNDEDATEKTFAALTENVVEALDGAAALHSGDYFAASPASINTFDTLLMGGVLCNHTEIGITVTEAVQI